MLRSERELTIFYEIPFLSSVTDYMRKNNWTTSLCLFSPSFSVFLQSDILTITIIYANFELTHVSYPLDQHSHCQKNKNDENFNWLQQEEEENFFLSCQPARKYYLST